MNKIKRGYIILGFSILLISIIFAYLNSAHDSNDVLININGYSMTLQQAIDNDFLNKSEDPPTENLTTKSDLSGSYHTGDEIFLCINENDMTLNNAINSEDGLSSNVSCSYSSDISFGHLGEEINIEINGDTKSLQESINDSDFNCIPDCEEENKECGDDGCGGSCGSCSGCQSCSNGNCVDDDSNCGSNEECMSANCVQRYNDWSGTCKKFCNSALGTTPYRVGVRSYRSVCYDGEPCEGYECPSCSNEYDLLGSSDRQFDMNECEKYKKQESFGGSGIGPSGDVYHCEIATVCFCHAD
ncbi:MAG: hypothetical protein ACOC1K_05085 [Nanoarchaeota archaeon]